MITVHKYVSLYTTIRRVVLSLPMKTRPPKRTNSHDRPRRLGNATWWQRWDSKHEGTTPEAAAVTLTHSPADLAIDAAGDLNRGRTARTSSTPTLGLRRLDRLQATQQLNKKDT